MKKILTAIVLFVSCQTYSQSNIETPAEDTSLNETFWIKTPKASERIEQYLDSCIKSKNYNICYDVTDLDSCLKANNLYIESGECTWSTINFMKLEISNDIVLITGKIKDPKTKIAFIQAEKEWNVFIDKMTETGLGINYELNQEWNRLITAGTIYDLVLYRYEYIKNTLDAYISREENELSKNQCN